MECFEDRFEWNDDKSYVRCKVCGREYKGGYNELVDLNRRYIEKMVLGNIKVILQKLSSQFLGKSNSNFRRWKGQEN